jgi:hypothetical protein
MNELWENLYETANYLVDQIEIDQITEVTEHAYRNLCDALDAITAKKNKEAFEISSFD